MVDWQQIIDEHGTTVWRRLWRMLGNRADADECFQETLLAALQVSRRQKIESWPALLRGLATARAMDRLRQRYRQNDLLGIAGDASGNGRPTPVESVASAEPDPSGRLVASELSQRLRKALACLPSKQAEAICLYALDGWSHQEIGLQLGMTENSVGVTIHRAWQRLRELLGDHPPLSRSGRGAEGEGSHSGREAGGGLP
jgi:RNA polymerase sigma-70 factor, ECF subfamily